ncbi:hypothetical protein [Kribbella deserti]|uniref:Uncharacterized protein n=1 Tax=Kribbella deserti TaxID=1926257 RepID=A0ABV6QEG6_9ACTN
MKFSVLALPLAALLPVVGALPAAATAPTARDCLESLNQHVAFGNRGMLTLDLKHRTLKVRAHDIEGGQCGDAWVSIAISRYDGSSVRNVNAVPEPGQAYVVASHPMGWADTGRWRVRQLAVTMNGQTVVKSYTLTDSPSTALVRRAAVLAGTVVPNDSTGFTASGTLKAYNSVGGLSPLPAGRQIWIEVRPRSDTSAPYKMVGETVTDSRGHWNFSTTKEFWKYDVRAVFDQPMETISPAYKWLGLVL